MRNASCHIRPLRGREKTLLTEPRKNKHLLKAMRWQGEAQFPRLFWTPGSHTSGLTSPQETLDNDLISFNSYACVRGLW